MNSKWFYMRAAYGKELTAKDYLESQGLEVYCPQHIVVERDGVRLKRKTESLIRNSLFVHSTANILHQYVGQPPLTFFHHYYRRHVDSDGKPIGSGHTPIIIPDQQMQQFMLWHNAEADDKIIRPESYTFKNGDRVLIKCGQFAGFEGHVIRYKGQTRVGTNIDCIGFIATAYIPKSFLIPLSDK